MIELYVGYCKGINESKEALSILKASPFVTGIEAFNVDKDFSFLKKAGLKFSLHNPLRILDLGLTDSQVISVLKKKENAFFFESIRGADAPSVGFHLHHKSAAVDVHFTKGLPLPKLTKDDEDLGRMKKNTIRNLIFLEKEINKGVPNNKKKKILFETQPYINHNLIKERENKLGKEYLDSFKKSSFFSTSKGIVSILNNDKIRKNNNIGLLFDASHIFIAIKNSINYGEINENFDECIKKIIKVSKGRVYQLHLASPTKCESGAYIDEQGELNKNNADDRKIFDIAKQVLKNNPNLRVITIEVEADPVSYYKKLVEQAEMVAKELNLKVEK